MLNTQPIEKRAQRGDGLLDVHSIFKTIQGEGPFCGVPCVFVRLAGCNLQCPACDTDYTSNRWFTDVETLLKLVTKQRGHGLVVITGGEPFRQDIEPLLRALLKRNYFVQIESNGTLPPPVVHYNTNLHDQRGVYIVCSPKTGKLHPTILEAACALKYVVQVGAIAFEDGLPLTALGHTASPFVARPPEGWNRPVYVQPMDSQDEAENKANMDCAVASCLVFGYTLQLQIHKYIGVE